MYSWRVLLTDGFGSFVFTFPGKGHSQQVCFTVPATQTYPLGNPFFCYFIDGLSTFIGNLQSTPTFFHRHRGGHLVTYDFRPHGCQHALVCAVLHRPTGGDTQKRGFGGLCCARRGPLHPHGLLLFSQDVRRGQRTTCGSGFSIPFTWVLRMEVRESVRLGGKALYPQSCYPHLFYV